ncbi:MAG: thermonuclease family protein [Halieaceae bacterium]|nr:thermonuclease family protein [Halieaceae bacterium]
MARRGRRRGRWLIIALVLLSAFQWWSDGEISWPNAVLDDLQEWANRPEASWRQASDTLNEAAPAIPEDFDLVGKVVRVSDGDSLSLLAADGKQYALRLYGVDAPERDQPFGDQSRAHLRRLVDGRSVGATVESVDDYQRQVVEVFIDGRSVNLMMLEAGMAWWYRYYARARSDMGEAERVARAKERGLWSQPDPVEPRRWRQQNRR